MKLELLTDEEIPRYGQYSENDLLEAQRAKTAWEIVEWMRDGNAVGLIEEALHNAGIPRPTAESTASE